MDDLPVGILNHFQANEPVDAAVGQNERPTGVVYKVVLPRRACRLRHDDEQQHVDDEEEHVKRSGGSEAVHEQRHVKPDLQQKHRGEDEGVEGGQVNRAAGGLRDNRDKLVQAEDEHQVEEHLYHGCPAKVAPCRLGAWGAHPCLLLFVHVARFVLVVWMFCPSQPRFKRRLVPCFALGRRPVAAIGLARASSLAFLSLYGNEASALVV